MRILLYFFFGLTIAVLLNHCKQASEAQKIVDRAIEKHGGDKYNNCRINFDFRDKHYSAQRKGGRFVYTREFDQGGRRIKDILTNSGFTRLVDEDTVTLSSEKANAYRNSTNSVIYFALLPYGLNNPAVQKEYIGESTIDSKDYYKIKITFQEEEGDKDHQDVYIYWFNKEDYGMDYFAYLFFENEGGIRFRDARNIRKVGGITFTDYDNYALDDTTFDLIKIDSLYKKGELKLLSEINLENISVETM